jgi:hypothetical protein
MNASQSWMARGSSLSGSPLPRRFSNDPQVCVIGHVEHRPTGPERRQENHNYETLQGATAYAGIALKKPTVRTVRV